jgi:uncharacterized membrane protein YfcA
VTLVPLLFVLGATVGSYGTLVGAGGGFLLMPVLLFLFPAEPITTLTSLSLAVVALNALSGTVAYTWKGRVDFRLGLLLALLAVPMTMLGASMAHLMPRGVFEVAFGLVLLGLAAFIIVRPLGPQVPYHHMGEETFERKPFWQRLRTGGPLVALIGWLSGLLGIGGSPPQVVVLTHLMDIPVSTAMPTVQFMVLLSAFGGVMTHVVIGEFHTSTATLLALGGGAFVGAQVGAAVSERISGVALIRLLAVALVLVGLGLIAKALRA